MFQKIIYFIIHRKSILILVTLALFLEVIFAIDLFTPILVDSIIDKNIFEIIVLLALVQMIFLLLEMLRQNPQAICFSENDCVTATAQIIQENRKSHHIHVLSCGLGSRMTLFSAIHDVNPKIHTEVLAQNPDYAIDKHDKDRSKVQLKILQRDYDYPAFPLSIRLFDEPASLRATLISDKDRNPIWGIVSWYRYHKSKDEDLIKVKGQGNPSLILNNKTESDKALLRFFMREFEHYWKGSKNQQVLP